MSEARKIEHSPGPWKAAGVHGGVLQYVVDAENWEVCVPRTQADIRLIAAAPDMLRLLRVLVPMSESGAEDREGWMAWNAALNEASELIARLDGQQP